jgi:hypothetical protein
MKPKKYYASQLLSTVPKANIRLTRKLERTVKTICCRLLLACVLAAAGSSAFAADAIESIPLQFAKGASSATVKGSIMGYQVIDYKLRARAGQSMSVKLATSNGASYFNVLPPGSTDVAVFIGSSGGNAWTGQLTADGEYKIRIYLMRSAARRNEVANYTLSVGITAGAAAAHELGQVPASDARVKGTPYHATGQVPCSMGTAAPGSARCVFGVIRGKPGNAEVHVTPPGGTTRVLTFIGGTVSSDAGARVMASRNGELWLVDVNDHEHYRIPDAVISGG